MQRLFHTIAFGCCLGAVLAACAGAGIGGSADTAAKAQEPRGTGPALSRVVDTESGGQNPGQIVLTLRNEGVETATNLQPMLLPFHFRMVHDGCSEAPLPSAASCVYKLALEENGPRTGTLALNVRYDYADMLDRSARVQLSYPVLPTPVPVAQARDN
jgi:hypothetical protein